jgi:hypothetical protein
MSEAENLGSRQEFERRVFELAATDADFRRALLDNPRQALSEKLQLELPGEVELKVLQETPTTFYLVLPVSPAEMSESDLEKISGGAKISKTQLLKL